MKLLLDTHSFLWFIMGSPKLGEKARSLIADALLALPFHHRDPFDRLLVARCSMERLPIISIDPVFDAYGIQRLW